jgi:hypothetical protein
MHNASPTQLTDSELIAEVARLASGERRTVGTLIAHLGELDVRGLHLGAGYSSLFMYCTQALRLSEGAAYTRIEVARLACRFPAMLELLEQGALHLATVRLLAPLLTEESHQELLATASYKSRRQVEELVRQRNPRPDVPSSVRKLPSAVRPSALAPGYGPEALPLAALPDCPEPGPQCPAPAAPFPMRHQVVTPLAPDRYQIRFTASAGTCEKLKRAQDLLRHAVPSGDAGEVFDRALTALLDVLERRKFAATDHPRPGTGQPPGSRYIPAQVKRAVADRDGGRCAFVGDTGRRCGERGFLEFHHVVPYASGGNPTLENIQLRCRPHNSYEAELWFGVRAPIPARLSPVAGIGTPTSG